MGEAEPSARGAGRAAISSTKAVEGFMALRAANTRAGLVIFAGDDAFIPTVYYDINRALLDEIHHLNLAGDPDR
jgi:hypothetical protein